MILRRYWFIFDVKLSDSPPPGVLMGCGVTAYDYEDAISILAESVFKNRKFPAIKRYVEDVDISTLDEKHVLPNMGIPLKRGVWFPMGYI